MAAPRNPAELVNGEIIKAAREAKGWSQQQLADESGTKQSTIHRIESGLTLWSRSSPNIRAALGLSESPVTTPALASSRSGWQVSNSGDGMRIAMNMTVSRAVGQRIVEILMAEPE